MKLLVDYIDQEILLSKDKIFSLEVTNKHYFYRLINDFCILSDGGINDSIKLYNISSFKEINISSKLNIFTNYFDFNLNNKKIINILVNDIEKQFTNIEVDKVRKNYLGIEKVIKAKFNNYNFAIDFNSEFSLKEIINLYKIKILQSKSLIDNLFTLIDVYKLYSSDSLLIFVNLKQYLTEQELYEFFKYCVYNEIYIVLIDINNYKIKNKFENKLIIDNDLFETMI